MRDRRSQLREFQARLSDRLRQATTTDRALRLGLMIGEERFLVDLSEAGEIVPMPTTLTAVPLTKEWFRGLVNLRGMLYAVSDLSGFGGQGPTPISKESRLLAVANRLNFNAAILVTRMLGLHNIGTMRADDTAPEQDATHPWRGRQLLDDQDRHWTELSLLRLVSDERFLMVNR
jgi:twitching motility protein PilI